MLLQAQGHSQPGPSGVSAGRSGAESPVPSPVPGSAPVPGSIPVPSSVPVPSPVPGSVPVPGSIPVPGSVPVPVSSSRVGAGSAKMGSTGGVDMLLICPKPWL